MNDYSMHFLKAALRTLYYTRLDHLFAPMTKSDGVIFMLHHVLPGEPDAFAPNRILRITPEFLTVVVEHVLDRDFECVSLDEAHERMRSGRRGAKRFAAFTFDDGYRDNITHALPIFRKYKVPMTIYVSPDFCDHKGRAWWLTFEKVLACSTAIEVELPDGPKIFDLSSVRQKFAAFREIYAFLRRLPDAAIHDHVDSWAERAGIDALAACRDLVVDWDELRALRSEPLISIGAHTMSHTSLAKCSEDEARWQIAASVEHVEHELRRRCDHFAYPYGDAGSAGPREFSMARDLGLKTAVTTRKGLISADASEQLLALPRFSLNGDFQDQQFLEVLLNGAPFKMLDIAKSALPRRAA